MIIRRNRVGDEAPLCRAEKDLLEACRIRQQGAVVDFGAERKMEPDALAAFLIGLAAL